MGRKHTIALKTDGTLWTWGNNGFGQLGDGSTTATSSPVQVGALTTWSRLTAGYYSSEVIKTDGTLWVWGQNSSGQLGTNNTTDYSSPVQVGALATWTRLSAATDFMGAVKQ